MKHKVIENVLSSELVARISSAYRFGPIYKGTHVYFHDYVNDVYDIEREKMRVTVHFVTGQPYQNTAQLRKEVNNGLLRVSTDYNTDPFLPEGLNLKFRALHDLHHAQTSDCNFNLDGEICAYSLAARYTNSALVRDWLFTEIVGQVCALRQYGEFPIQRTVILSSDYRQIADNAYGLNYV